MKGYISTTEAAHRLGVSVESGRIRQMIREGKLEAEKIGRDWMVSEAAVVAELSNRER
jgi:excisionase family DNA binding protein